MVILSPMERSEVSHGVGHNFRDSCCKERLLKVLNLGHLMSLVFIDQQEIVGEVIRLPQSAHGNLFHEFIEVEM
jgi:hypothetical protein